MKDIGLQDDDYKVLSANEVIDEFRGYDNLYVKQGEYKIPKAGDMPIGEWCVMDGPKPDDWVCTHYAKWADYKMWGYAFGIAQKDQHRYNALLIDDDGDIKPAFYDPQNCLWINKIPDSIDIR